MLDIGPPEDWIAGMSAKGRETADAIAGRRDLVTVVSAWAGSVRAIIEDRGDDYYDDYYIYVSWREVIDKMISALPEADASIVMRAIEREDAKFREHTFDDGGRALSRVHNVDTERWYWRRVPIRGHIARSLGIDTG